MGSSDEIGYDALTNEPTKNPAYRLSLERMMGLEPTTFCMASRRSSQLSYIRAGAKYSPAYVVSRASLTSLSASSLCSRRTAL
jgi:hypothetical protein